MTKYYVKVYVMIVDIIFVKRYKVSCKSVEEVQDTEERITLEQSMVNRIVGFSNYWEEDREVTEEEAELFREDGYTVYSKNITKDDLLAEAMMHMSNDELNAIMDDESLWE